MNGLRTLIIDGALFTLKDMMGALSREMPGGSEFDKAVSIHEAAEKYHSFRPTRILVNYAMAGLRFGQEPFIDVLVQRTNVPIVAYGISRAMEPEAMKAGVSAFVTKPIARDRLPAFYRECADQLQKSARTPAVSRPAAKKSAPPSVRSRAATVGSLTRPDVRPSASAQSRPSRPAALQPHLRTRADRAVEAAQQAIAIVASRMMAFIGLCGVARLVDCFVDWCLLMVIGDLWRINKDPLFFFEGGSYFFIRRIVELVENSPHWRFYTWRRSTRRLY